LAVVYWIFIVWGKGKVAERIKAKGIKDEARREA
jgi:hypothetical protein